MTESAKESSLSSVVATSNSTSFLTSLRTARVTRAVALFVVGIVIAFTPTSHENLAANRWMVMAAFALLGLATLFEHFVQRNDRASWPIALRAALMFFAAIAVLLSSDGLGLTVVVAIWAIANALMLFLPVIGTPELRKQMLPAALLSLALAVVVLLLRDDPVAVIGFFGVYALICAVFLGISAFDSRPTPGGVAPETTYVDAKLNDPGPGLSQTSTSQTESTR